MASIFLFSNIPGLLIGLIGPAAIIAIGWLFEKDFTGKFVTFANGIAINLAFVSSFSPSRTLDFTQWALVAYLDVGLVLGVLGLLSFTEKIKLPPIFDTLAMAYSTIPAGIMILVSLVNFF